MYRGQNPNGFHPPAMVAREMLYTRVSVDELGERVQHSSRRVQAKCAGNGGVPGSATNPRSESKITLTESEAAFIRAAADLPETHEWTQLEFNKACAMARRGVGFELIITITAAKRARRRIRVR